MAINESPTIDKNGAELDMEMLAGKYLTFSLSEEDFGLEILRVREIIGMQEITPIPRTPEFVQGVINLRGKVIPVIDLRLKFGMSYKESDDRTCIIVAEISHNRSSTLMGIIVDRVNEVVDVKVAEVEPMPSFGMQLNTDFIRGMAKHGKKVKTLLDINKVLNRDEATALTGFEEVS